MRLKDRVAIVTGGAMGIGRGIVLCMAREGADVAIADLQAEGAAKVAEEVKALGRKALVVTTDVTRPGDFDALFQRVRQELGKIDVLVNNAGVACKPGMPFTNNTEEDWDRVHSVNVKAVFFACKAIAPYFIERRAGRIINIASIAGKEGNPTLVPYSTAKAGVIGLTKALAKEVATRGILVNAVAPAVIGTDLLKQMSKETVDSLIAKIPMGRIGAPAEVAALVAWLASDECSFSTGAVYDLSGGRATY